VDECKPLAVGHLQNSVLRAALAGWAERVLEAKEMRDRVAKVGRCRFTVSKPVLKAPMSTVSALEATIS
jgi:hypothetical protein